MIGCIHQKTFFFAATAPANCTSPTDDDNNEEYEAYASAFDSPFDAFIVLFVLVTTENYPDIMIPAYKEWWWNFWCEFAPASARLRACFCACLRACVCVSASASTCARVCVFACACLCACAFSRWDSLRTL